MIDLPPPGDTGTTLVAALRARRSIRTFTDETLSMEQISDLLWATAGRTGPDGRYTAPAAGNLSALGVVIATHAGLFRYEPAHHALAEIRAGDLRLAIGDACGQDCVRTAAVVIVLAATPAVPAAKYDERAPRYVDFEMGHAAQNTLLEATALGLGAVPVGSFDDDAVTALIEAADGEIARYLIPVGVPAA
jgi:SagB-type dehydrogenase family enzyme